MSDDRRVEVLSPAGDIEKLRTVIEYGADAVYMSGKSFGLRTFSGNFTRDEMVEGISFAHSRGVKCYVTMNILATEEDLKFLDEEIDFVAHVAKADAVLVSDPGIFAHIRKVAPDLEIHISTQASVTNSAACKFWYDQGARRIVLAREVSLAQIRKIREEIPEDCQIECFVHGAMCYSYSGCCLFSSMAGGRSGNRGRCAGPCRKPYSVYDDMESAVKGRNGSDYYPLSMRDMCVIGHSGDMADAGVDSLKIEGRMKAPEYAAGVSHIYKTALTKYESGTLNKNDIKNYENDLRQLYIRSKVGTGYLYEYNGPDMLTLDHL